MSSRLHQPFFGKSGDRLFVSLIRVSFVMQFESHMIHGRVRGKTASVAWYVLALVVFMLDVDISVSPTSHVLRVGKRSR